MTKFARTVIVQLHTGVGRNDGGKETDRGLVALPVRHVGGVGWSDEELARAMSIVQN